MPSFVLENYSRALLTSNPEVERCPVIQQIADRQSPTRLKLNDQGFLEGRFPVSPWCLGPRVP